MFSSRFESRFDDPLADQRSSRTRADLELALQLEHGDPDDPALLEALINRYAGEVYRLGRALTRGYTGQAQAKAELRALVRKVFLAALCNQADFRGQVSVRGWLYGLTIDLTKGRRWLRRRRGFLARLSGEKAERDPASNQAGPEQDAGELLAALDALPEPARLVTILRMQCDLEVEEIGQVLDCTPEEVHARLERAWDGLTQAVSGERDALVLATRQAVRARLREQDFQPGDALRLKALALARRPRRIPSIELPAAKFGGMALVILFAGVSAWLGVQLNRQIDADLQPPSGEGPPAPLEITDPVMRGLAPGEPGSAPVMPNLFNSEPSLSADGRFLAFTSTVANPSEGEEQVNVYVYDRDSGSIELVSASGEGIPAGGASRSPGISGDGRWVVFSSTAPDLAAEGSPACPALWDNLLGDCTHIYLYNRQYGYTQLLSEGRGGASPSISADGRVIVYWSAAEQPSPGQEARCHPMGCASLALYDRVSGRTDELPIGRVQPPLTPLSLSADGRYIALTLFSGGFDVSHADVFVYDRWDGVFEPQNLTSKGTPVAGMSFNPAISADGRYLAFASSAELLVQGDTNQRIDAFLRDRQTGRVDLISRAPDGQPGNDDSGISPFGNNSFERYIDISPDGRFVLFTSNAQNLAPGETELCGDFFNLPPCNQVLLYDRQGDGLRQVSAGGGESLYSYPEISADGRWAAVMEQSLHCTYFEVCANIRLQDLVNGESFFLNPDPGFTAGEDTWAQFLGGADRPRSRVNALAYSPDGRVLAVGTNSGEVELWGFPERELLHTLVGHEKLVTSLAFSPDGATLASGSHDATVLLWRLADGALLARFHGLPGLVRSLAFSPDGRYLAVGALRAIWIWENTGERFEPVKRYDYPTSYVEGLTYTPDGRYLIFSPGDRYVWIQRVADGEVVLRLAGHSGRIKSIALSPDGGYLATSAQDFQANLWRLLPGLEGELAAEYLYSLRHDEWVSSVAFSPDGELLATAAYDHAIRLWNVAGGDLSLEYPDRRYQVLNLAFSPDGETLAAGTTVSRVALRAVRP